MDSFEMKQEDSEEPVVKREPNSEEVSLDQLSEWVKRWNEDTMRTALEPEERRVHAHRSARPRRPLPTTLPESRLPNAVWRRAELDDEGPVRARRRRALTIRESIEWRNEQ